MASFCEVFECKAPQTLVSRKPLEDFVSKTHEQEGKYKYNLANHLSIPTVCGMGSFNWEQNHRDVFLQSPTHYPGSVLAEYAQRLPREKLNRHQVFDANLMKQVLTNFAGPTEELVIHLRLGDMGGDSKFTQYVTDVTRLASKLGVRSARVLCGCHNSIPYHDANRRPKMLEYTRSTYEKLQESLNKVGCVAVHKPDTADESLVVMFRAKNLVLHRGTFSALGGLVCSGKVWCTPSFDWLNGVRKHVDVSMINDRAQLLRSTQLFKREPAARALSRLFP